MTHRIRTTLPRWLATTIVLGTIGCCPALALDAFDRHGLAELRQALKAAEPAAEITSARAAELKLLGRGVESPCIVVRTAGGNLAKVLLSWGLRKTSDKPVPVVMLDRYVTYDPQRGGQTAASGKNVMLFAGFGFDLDIGQVVPVEAGADVQFTEDRKLAAVGETGIFALDGPVVAAESASGTPDPNDHEGVLPRDFAGVWRLNADGRWLGALELAADEEGNLTGSYLSDETQSSYPAYGRVDADTHRANLTIELNNSEQTFEAYLWTSDKSTMAGVTTLAERRFGFYATRENPASDDAPQEGSE
jgi:hypothetical protein